MARKPSDTVQLKLRFPEKLRLRIEAAAARNEHSMNAEIVQRLEQSFAKEDQAGLMQRVATAAATATVEQMRIVDALAESLKKRGER